MYKRQEVFRDIIRYCNELEVASVTFYAFSTENWSRPLEEVNGIMKLFGEYLVMAYDYQKENNRVVFLGDRTVLSQRHQDMMNDIEEKTRNNTGTILNVAVNYGGRQEIVRAAQRCAQRVAAGEIRPEDIDVAMMSDNMYTAGQKDPDFIPVSYTHLNMLLFLYENGVEPQQLLEILDDIAAQEGDMP